MSNTVVSLGEDKRFLQFDLRTLKTSEFVSKEGIHSFTLTKTGKNALLIEGADLVEVKSTKMRNDISIFKSNAITGMAQWIDLSTMKSTQIFPENVTSGTVLSAHESVALLTKEGNVVIIDPATQQVLRTIRTATRQPIAIASSRNGSLIATLSKDVSVAVWNSELGQLVSEFENRTRSVLGQDAIFRQQWKPFTDNDDWLMKGGQALHALPIGLEAFAKKHAPRMLTEDERERYQVDRIPLTNASPGF
jgi:WD40 repeat protein